MPATRTLAEIDDTLVSFLKEKPRTHADLASLFAADLAGLRLVLHHLQEAGRVVLDGQTLSLAPIRAELEAAVIPQDGHPAAPVVNRMEARVRRAPDRSPIWDDVTPRQRCAWFEHEGRRHRITEVHTLRQWRLETDLLPDKEAARQALQAFGQAYGYVLAMSRVRPIRRRGGRGSGRTWEQELALRGRQSRIVRRLEAGPCASWELEEPGMGRKTVRRHLATLVREGRVRRQGLIYFNVVSGAASNDSSPRTAEGGIAA